MFNIKPKKRLGFPTLTFDSKLPTGSRLKFDLLVKEKGKVKRINLGLPKNRALSKLKSNIDNSILRSAQLVISGITKTKDIGKPVLNKFRVGKTKTTLNLVEKTKYSIDSKGEKKQLKIARKSARKKRL